MFACKKHTLCQKSENVPSKSVSGCRSPGPLLRSPGLIHLCQLVTSQNELLLTWNFEAKSAFNLQYNHLSLNHKGNTWGSNFEGSLLTMFCHLCLSYLRVGDTYPTPPLYTSQCYCNKNLPQPLSSNSTYSWNSFPTRFYMHIKLSAMYNHTVQMTVKIHRFLCAWQAKHWYSLFNLLTNTSVENK